MKQFYLMVIRLSQLIISPVYFFTDSFPILVTTFLQLYFLIQALNIEFWMQNLHKIIINYCGS